MKGLVASLAIMVVILAALATGMLAGWRPSLDLLRGETTDRTGPSVLHSLTNLSEYHAASGHYETVVDLEKKDISFLPDVVSGERVLYVGKGDVDAVVDFGELDERRVTLSQDRRSVTLRLPAPVAGKPVLDLETSYVASHDEGIINKFKGSEVEREAQLKATAQMSTAANSEGMLVDRAKENTSAMLRSLFGSLGYTSISITFEEDSL